MRTPNNRKIHQHKRVWVFFASSASCASRSSWEAWEAKKPEYILADVSRLRYSEWNFQAQFHSQVCKLLQDIVRERNQEEDFDYQYREGNLLEEDSIFEKEDFLRVN